MMIRYNYDASGNMMRRRTTKAGGWHIVHVPTGELVKGRKALREMYNDERSCTNAFNETKEYFEGVISDVGFYSAANKAQARHELEFLAECEVVQYNGKKVGDE